MKEKTILGVAFVIAIVGMLSIGIPLAQYMQADVSTKTIEEKDYGCGEIQYDGEPEYCPIASGAQYVLDGIASGEFTFSELQSYLDSISGSSQVSDSVSQIERVRISFDAIPAQIPDKEDEDILPVDVRKIVDQTQTIDVLEELLEKLPQADVYCEEPEGDHPSDWQLHPKALCLAAAMTPIVGAAIANGAVVMFYALFGDLAQAVGLTQWLLILRGFGVAEALMGTAENIYNTCMDLIG